MAAMPPAFHAPSELRRICKVFYLGSYALQNMFPCIRKASHPECIGFIRISPALRILSVVLFIDIGQEDFIFCAASSWHRTPSCLPKHVLLWVVRHQELECVLALGRVKGSQARVHLCSTLLHGFELSLPNSLQLRWHTQTHLVQRDEDGEGSRSLGYCAH